MMMMDAPQSNHRMSLLDHIASHPELHALPEPSSPERMARLEEMARSIGRALAAAADEEEAAEAGDDDVESEVADSPRAPIPRIALNHHQRAAAEAPLPSSSLSSLQPGPPGGGGPS